MVLRSMNRERRRLLASLFFNFAAKVPGIAAVFLILPLISRSLGTREYGELLSALALGSSFTLPFGGINAVGRRLLSDRRPSSASLAERRCRALRNSALSAVALSNR